MGKNKYEGTFTVSITVSFDSNHEYGSDKFIDDYMETLITVVDAIEAVKSVSLVDIHDDDDNITVVEENV